MKIENFFTKNSGRRYFPVYSKWVFILSLISIALFYDYHEILTKEPQGIHLWRQTDCLSMTLNYKQDNNDFLEPSVHYLGRDNTGRTVSDFPLIYYTVGNLWKVFGQYEYIYRLLIIFIYFIGLFAIFRIFEDVLKDSILAIASSLLLFASPVLVYYANNFLMNIPALSFALIGMYFFYNYYKTEKVNNIYLMSFFYLLAGLLKVSSMISFIGILSLFILDLFKVKMKPGGQLFPRAKLKIAFVFLLVILIQVTWYLYAKYYNEEHNPGIFLIGTLPIWEMTSQSIRTVLDYIVYHVKTDYFWKYTQLFLVGIFLLTLVFYKKTNRLLLYLSVILAIGFFSYILLFFKALQSHDYYVINLYILVPIVLLTFLIFLEDNFRHFFRSIVFKLLLIIFLVINISFTRKKIDDRYNGWQNSYYKKIEAFNEISPYLRSIGIEKEDKVLSLSDQSINITLYMMNQKGWTNYGIQGDSLKIQKKINQGAKYLIVLDEKSDDIQKVFTQNKIGEYKNIDIYKL